MNFKLPLIRLEALFFACLIFLVGCYKGNHPKTDEFLQGRLEASEVSEISVRMIPTGNHLQRFEEYDSKEYRSEDQSQLSRFLEFVHAGSVKGKSGNMPEANSGEDDFVAKIGFHRGDELLFYRVTSEGKGIMLRVATGFDYIDGPFSGSSQILQWVQSEWALGSHL